MVRQEKSKKTAQAKDKRNDRPQRLKGKRALAGHPPRQREHNSKEVLLPGMMVTQQSVVHPLQTDKQDNPFPLSLEHTCLPNDHPSLPTIPPPSSVLIGQPNQNQSVLAQPSDTAIRWGSADEAFSLQWPLWDDFYHQESSDIWHPRQFMQLRRPKHDSPQKPRFHLADEAPIERERPVEKLEVALEEEGRLLEESRMKNEQEGCADGPDGYEDDLDWYEEWMQAQTARSQPA